MKVSVKGSVKKGQRDCEILQQQGPPYRLYKIHIESDEKVM